LKILLISSNILSLKQGIIDKAAYIIVNITAIKIINKYWLRFTKILFESIPELRRLLNWIDDFYIFKISSIC
jgi:hypothetical protein